jgi:glycosyltransferase involved in cell wall biosynthesis
LAQYNEPLADPHRQFIRHMKLTVAIPTYNRNKILNQTLAMLLPQLTVDCKLLIIDNCSDVPIVSTLQDLLAKFPGVRARIIRNRVNIGACANVLRCFELCETEWLWILCDAYQIRPEAVRTALDSVSEHNNCLYINFKHPAITRAQTRIGYGIKGFVELMDNFGMALMTSTCVFRASELLKYLPQGFHFAHTLSPHLVLLLCALADNRPVCYSKEEIVVSKGPVGDNNWSIMLYLLTLGLVDVPMPPGEATILKRKILLDINQHMRGIVLTAATNAAQAKSARRSVYQFDTYCFKALYGHLLLAQRLKLGLLRFLFRYPKFTLALHRAFRGDNRRIRCGYTDGIW